MLSERIKNLRLAFEPYRNTGFDAAPFGAALVLAILQSFEDEATELENSCISPVARAGCDLPDNVIRIAWKLHKQGVRLGMPDGAA